mgnify:CR=1 FL=1
MLFRSDAYREEFGVGHSSVAGSQKRVFARAAAFMNGTISHIAEFDDIFRDGAYHPACPTISAALALAESRNAPIEDLLASIIIGYEVSTRISKVIQPSHYQYFHTTGTVGVFGAAAACAHLLQLNASQACDALATAGTFASGLQQAFRSDSMTKPMHPGHAAEVGLNAALLAQAASQSAFRCRDTPLAVGRCRSNRHACAIWHKAAATAPSGARPAALTSDLRTQAPVRRVVHGRAA